MSVYHYYMALDSILLACSTIAVVFAASWGNLWKTWAGPFRFLSTLIIFVFPAVFLSYQTTKLPYSNFPELFPPIGHPDSAVLLPVSCFLDPDLIDKESPWARHPQRPLTEVQLADIGRPTMTLKLPQIWLFAFLTFFLCLSGLIDFLALVCKWSGWHRSGPKKWLLGSIILLSLGTDIFCASHMFMLKQWTSQSGWLADKREEGYYSISQLLPLLSLATIVIAILDAFRLGCGRRSKDEKHKGSNGYQMI